MGILHYPQIRAARNKNIELKDCPTLFVPFFFKNVPKTS